MRALVFLKLFFNMAAEMLTNQLSVNPNVGL